MSEPRPLRVMIVDDEAPARSRMRDLLAECAEAIPPLLEMGPVRNRCDPMAHAARGPQGGGAQVGPRFGSVGVRHRPSRCLLRNG